MKVILPFLLFLHIWKARQQPTGQPSELECCQNKTVGDYGYILADEGEVPSACKSRCIYQREDDPTSRFCFAPGQLPVNCGGVLQRPCTKGLLFIGSRIETTNTNGYLECSELCFQKRFQNP